MLRLFFLTLLIGQAAENPCVTGSEASRKNEHEQAVALLTTCLRSGISNEYRVSMLMVRGQSYMGLKNYRLAAQDIDEAIFLDKSGNAWPWIVLSMCRRQEKKYDKALEAIAKAEKLDEDGPGSGPGMAVNYHKGWALQDAGRHKEAIEAYTRGIKHQPTYGWAFYQRGLSHEALGDKKRARRDFAQAAKINPEGGYEEHIVKKLKQYGFKAKLRKK